MCVEPFEPNINSKETDILIVEGYINVGPGKTRILLSKASPLSQREASIREKNAEVFIESDANESFPLSESSDGVYQSEELNLPADKKYRLRIKSQDGIEYESAMTRAKLTPAIDSISWEWKPDRLYIYVSAHDASGLTKFYKWDFRHAWQINSPYSSDIKYQNGELINTSAEEIEDMQTCYQAQGSTGFMIASTQNLNEDAAKFLLQAWAHGAEETRVRYVMEVSQHTISEDEYKYLALIEKNSTQTGSFFDPMPSQLYGNIHDVANVDRLVVGHVGVYTTEILKLVINGSELPSVPIQDNCKTTEFLKTPSNLESSLGGQPPAYIAMDTFLMDNQIWVRAMEAFCVDCRIRASSVRPDFWPRQ